MWKLISTRTSERFQRESLAIVDVTRQSKNLLLRLNISNTRNISIESMILRFSDFQLSIIEFLIPSIRISNVTNETSSR